MIWFMYEKWSDVKVFTYEYKSYLLQARKNKLTRGTQFRIADTTFLLWGANCSNLTEEDMKEAGAWESKEKNNETP